MPRTPPDKLSRREDEVALLIAEGLSNRDIAKRLFISERTVEWHVDQIFNKLGLHARAQIAAWIAEKRVSHRSFEGRKPRSNLPVQLTSFVGRERELSDLAQLLGRSRLVTLTGPGGVGKTRLALGLASRSHALYPDGVWLVELASVSDQSLVTQTLGAAIGITEIPQRPLLETVLSVIGGWQALFVLDNCEHLIEAAALICEQVLMRCPNVRLLVTSREAIRARGEVLWPVEGMARADAVDLFEARGRQADPNFAVAESAAKTVVDICQALDDLPLAVELAAARLSVMSPDAILEHLDRRFRLLTGGSRTAPLRQRTLAATVEWSYELLSEAEKVLFQRLSVFNGSFTAEAAEAVCSGDPLRSGDVLPLVLRLAERSMVSTLRTRAGATRYRLLETLRQYGLELLEANESGEAFRQRHAGYFKALTDEAYVGFRYTERGKWVERLDTEIDNLRAAFDWAVTHEPSVALRITTNLEVLWWGRGYLTEAFDRMQLALTRTPEQNLLRVNALFSASFIAYTTGRFSESRQFNDEAAALARQVAPPEELGYCLVNAGDGAIKLGDLKGGEDLLLEGLELMVPTGDGPLDRRRLAYALNWLGWLNYKKGDLDGALMYSNQALQALDGGKTSPPLHGIILDHLGWIALANQDVATARDHFREELKIGLGTQELGKVLLSLQGLGTVAAAASQPERALRLMGATTALQKRQGFNQPPQDPQLWTRWQSNARRALGADGAESTWNEGGRMTIDQAVDYALAEQLEVPTKGRPVEPARN